MYREDRDGEGKNLRGATQSRKGYGLYVNLKLRETMLYKDGTVLRYPPSKQIPIVTTLQQHDVFVVTMLQSNVVTTTI